MKRGVLFVAWGDKFIEELERCRVSVEERLGLPTCLITDQNTDVDESKFYKVLRPDFGKLRGNGCKSIMYRLSPFRQSLFLDTDTVVVNSDLEYGFNKAEKFGIALCQPPLFLLRERIRSLDTDDHIMYNSGVIFFEKGPDVERVFNTYEDLCATTRSKTDQQFLSLSMHENNYNPFGLPLTWNLRAHFGQGCTYIYGPIKIWHTRKPVPDNIDEYNKVWRAVAGVSKYNYSREQKRGYIRYEIKQGRSLE
tara:strand:+ start:2309 stop:3061 length:753 start_codon:yes stop_codon:yes gene_type:complete